MNKAVGTFAAVAAGVGAVVVRRVRAARHSGRPAESGAAPGFHVVTINRPPEEVAPSGTLPAPLAELGDSVETRVRPAPGDRGTELAVRLREPFPSSKVRQGVARIRGDDPRQAVRSALRRAKQLVEVGEVLALDPQPAGRRTRTPAGMVLDAVTRRAGGEGVR